jgi:hypothetical protein
MICRSGYYLRQFVLDAFEIQYLLRRHRTL